MKTINLGYLILSLTAVVGFTKLALLLLWTRKLYKEHGNSHSFAELFGMMFRPNSASDVNGALWSDLQPIQRKNILSNVLLVVLAFLVLIGGIAFNRSL